ncbi:MAG: Ca2+/Na+ antiporter [Paracoccaceae bacterium]|jgi:Ca2+/Na+ antiporter
MIGAIRLFAMAFLLLSVVFVYISLRQKYRCRRELEANFDAKAAPDTSEKDRDAYIEAGLAEYEGSLRRKLIFGIYVVPLIGVALMIYVTNFM